MTGRMRILGVVLAIFGLAFLAGGGYAFLRTQEGVRSLQAFSAAQDVKLTYNEQGQLSTVARPRKPSRSWRSSRRTGATRSSRAT